MASAAQAIPENLVMAGSVCRSTQPLWYAAYTAPNHEKRVAEQLDCRSIQHLLPTYESRRRWQDRYKILHLPLFPGYVFVRMALEDRLQVLTIPGVVHLVGVNHRPSPIPEPEIESVRTCMDRQLRLEPYPYLRVGRRVRVRNGALAGLEGVLVRKKNRHRLVLSLHLIERAVATEIEASDVVPLY